MSAEQQTRRLMTRIPDPEPVTDRDRQIMQAAGGAIVVHVPSGLLGHAYPTRTDFLPGGQLASPNREYRIVEDFRR